MELQEAERRRPVETPFCLPYVKHKRVFFWTLQVGFVSWNMLSGSEEHFSLTWPFVGGFLMKPQTISLHPQPLQNSKDQGFSKRPRDEGGKRNHLESELPQGDAVFSWHCPPCDPRNSLSENCLQNGSWRLLSHRLQLLSDRLYPLWALCGWNVFEVASDYSQQCGH